MTNFTYKIAVVKNYIKLSSDEFSSYGLAIYFLPLNRPLGLGHVDAQSVMNPDFRDFSFQGLQTADSIEIVEIYGEQ